MSAPPSSGLSSSSAFAPASVSNVACGFDCLGFAVDGLGDEVVAEIREEPGVAIVEMTGDGGRLPRDAARNTAGVAVRSLLAAAGFETARVGIALRVHKRMPLASGLGSSAASGVAAARAAAEGLGIEPERELLLRCALEGERVACGSAHPDNVTPSLYGGLVLIRSAEPLDVVELPVPEGLFCALIRPHVEVETRAAREALGSEVELAAAARQWANLGALISALYTENWRLLSRSLVDAVAEPKRRHLVPGFGTVQEAAREAGALGCSFSGSGPTVFALCRGHAAAEVAAEAMAEAARRSGGLECDAATSRVGAEGVRLLPSPG
ncbi:MAG: homoserine kinase [Acidobacteriota bacterium]